MPLIAQRTHKQQQINQNRKRIRTKLNEKSLTWISSRGASGTVNNLERPFENRGKRKLVVNAAVLDFTVDGGESAGNWAGSDISSGEPTVRYERWRHRKLELPNSRRDTAVRLWEWESERERDLVWGREKRGCMKLV